MSVREFLEKTLTLPIDGRHTHPYDNDRFVDDYREYAQYQLLQNKIVFEPLTVEICRLNVNKEIPTYFQNGGLGPNNKIYGPTMVENVRDRNKPEKVFTIIFIPNGDARFGDEVVEGWLADPSTQDYEFTREDVERGFFLQGWVKFPKNMDWREWEVFLLDKCGTLATNGSGNSFVQA